MVYKVLARGDLTSDLNAREREREKGGSPACSGAISRLSPALDWLPSTALPPATQFWSAILIFFWWLQEG